MYSGSAHTAHFELPRQFGIDQTRQRHPASYVDWGRLGVVGGRGGIPSVEAAMAEGASKTRDPDVESGSRGNFSLEVEMLVEIYGQKLDALVNLLV